MTKPSLGIQFPHLPYGEFHGPDPGPNMKKETRGDLRGQGDDGGSTPVPSKPPQKFGQLHNLPP